MQVTKDGSLKLEGFLSMYELQTFSDPNETWKGAHSCSCCDRHMVCAVWVVVWWAARATYAHALRSSDVLKNGYDLKLKCVAPFACVYVSYLLSLYVSVSLCQ